MHHRLSLAASALAAAFSTLPAYAAEDAPGAIIVTATRQPTRHNELLSDSTWIDRETIAQAAPLQTLGDLLQREAGIESLTTGAPGANTSIFIRGGNAGHTLLLIDGQRVGSATLGEASFSRLPLGQVERVEILRGPASALYGADAIGGVVQIFTRPALDGTRVDASAGAGTYGTREANAGFATRSGALSASLRGGVLKTEGFNTKPNPADGAYNTDRDGYENKHVSGSLAWAFDRNHELAASIFHSNGENRYDSVWYDALFNPHADFDFRTKTKLTSASASSTNRFTPNWTSRLHLGQGIDDSANSDAPGSESRFKTTQRQLGWQNDLRLPVGKALLAVERLEQAIDTSSTYVATERTISSALAGWSGVVGSHRLQANLRRDRNSQFGGKTTGVAGYGYQVNDRWRVRSSASTAFKAPTFNDLYFPDQPFVGGGNPNLKPERARSVEVGVNRESATGTLALTAYRTRVSDLIEWRPDDPSDPFSPWHPANVGRADLKGLSFAGRQRYGRLAVRASADVQSHKDAVSDKQLLLRARRHGALGADYDFGGAKLGADFVGVGRRYNDSTNATELPGYALVNLRAEYGLGRDWTLFGRLDNALDRDYETRRGYATAGRTAFVGMRYSR